MTFNQFLLKKIKDSIVEITHIDNSYEILFYTNGRSAIYTFFNALEKFQRRNIILLPDYVCNVVEKSIRLAGCRNIIFYKITHTLLPDEEDLFLKINEFQPDVIVFAPIFGSYGEKYIKIMKKVSTSKKKPVIVLDFAQDLNIKLPSFIDVSITSFNKKSINGFMGGVLIAKKNILSKYTVKMVPLNVIEESIFCLLFLKSVLSLAYHKMSVSFKEPLVQKYDYSECKNMPFLISNKEISIISSVIAIFELKKLTKYEKIRKNNLFSINEILSTIHGIQLIQTERLEFSPYIPFYIENNEAKPEIINLIYKTKIRIKFPYSKEMDPDESMKNDLYVLENGFKKINI